jgi:multidrug resistance efflux pump
MTRARLLSSVVIVAVIAGVLAPFGLTQAQRKSENGAGESTVHKASAPAKKADVLKVTKKSFKVELSVKGNLEPEGAAEIYFRPEPMANPSNEFTPLIITKVVEHGTHVNKGDVLIAFDTRKIDLILREVKAEKKVLDANLKLAQEELPAAEKAAPVELASAERGKTRAEEDDKYFREIGRAQTERIANFSVKSAEFFLEFEREQLRQLEKMYKSKDLTEETEQIILKRQRHWVDMAERRLKETQISRDYTLNVELPRKEKDLSENIVQKGLALEKFRATQAPTLTQKRQTLAKMLADREKLNDRLHKLERDRARLVLTAPTEGIVYYGRLHRGQWSSASTLAGKLVPNGIAPADETLMTVVRPRPLALRLAIEEKDLHLVKPGLEGKAHPVFQPDVKLKATMARVSSVPSIPGQFEALVNVDLAGCEALMPGMACTVKFVPYSQKEAIAVPVAALSEDGDKHFVTVVHADGNNEKREVITGETNHGYTEILSGLQEGEEIMREAQKRKS